MSDDLFDFKPVIQDYAVMGNPISHSLSPSIHKAFAQQTQQTLRYEAIQVDVGGFAQAVGNFFGSGGKGLNITVPFKNEAWKLAHSLSNQAQHAKAVNTLWMDGNQQLVGDNTDGVGLVRDIKKNLTITIKGKRLLIIGAGGATRGLVLPLINEKIKSLHIVNRTIAKAEQIASEFKDKFQLSTSGFEDLPGLDSFDIILNASAASLNNEALVLPASLVNSKSICYDLMYHKKPTPFMNWGLNHGAKASYDGIGMLIEQAAESFYLWRDVRPDTSSMISAYRP